MEPEDLPWPSELEEEEEEEEEEREEEEEEKEKEEVEKPENLDEVEVVMVEEVEEEERRELDEDLNYESEALESTDDEEDDEAKAWLQAHPGGTLPPPPPPKHRYSESERTGPEKVVPLTSHVWQQSSYKDKNRTPISDSNVASLEETAQWGSGDDQRTESWHFLPQEIDSSHTSDTTQTRFKVREKGTEMTDLPSVEESILTQSENQVKEPNRDLFCSPLLVIQDSFASPDLPLLTCLTQEEEFGPDSLFHQSELDFAPLRGVPGKSEDAEWFSRPSEVSEALFQAASEVTSDLGNSCFSVSQHTLIGSTAFESQGSFSSTAVESQGSFSHPKQGTKEEIVSSDTVDEPKTPKDSDSYDALCSHMSWKTQEVTQEPETTLADKDQLSVSTSSDTSDEYITPKASDSFDASCLYVQYWKQEVLQQSENYLTHKDHDSCSDSSDPIDKNKVSEGSGNFSVPFSCMPWSKQGVSHHLNACRISKDCISFPSEVAPHFNNEMSYCFLHCLLKRKGESVPLMSDSHYFDSVYLRSPAKDEVKQRMVSLEGYERNEECLGKELSQCFELKENSSTLVFSEMCPRSSEIQYIDNVVVPDNSARVSETHMLSREHDTSKVGTSGGLQSITSNLDETSEQLYFQEERNHKTSAAFGGENVISTENVAFEAVIASIEPLKKVSTVNETQADINKSLTNYSQESEPKKSDLFLLNYNDSNCFSDKFSYPHYHSTPMVNEPAASKSLLHKKYDDVSSLYWYTNVNLLPSAPQEMFIRPLSSASLSEKSLCKTQSPLFQCDVDNEPFLPIAERAGSSNIIYPLKVSTSDSLFLQDLKQQTFEEVADSSKYILGKNVNSNHVIEGPSAAVGNSFSANLVAHDAKSQGALPMINDASLIAVGQETLLKADEGLGEIPRPMGAKSSFIIHTIMQNDSYFVEGLQGKSESDVCTLGDDTECCSLDENAVICSQRSSELQREVCDQDDLTGECIELACLDNLLDDLEICDSSLPWQSALQQPSKEESSFEDPVGHSNTDINQSFSSVLPPFIPHEPSRELEYHSSDLRMLRVSPEIVPKTLKHLSGGITEITQPNLKTGISTTSGDSDIGSYLPLTSEDFTQLAVRSSVETSIGLHTDSLNEQTLADGHVTEETLKVLADQKAGISTLPSSSYSLREKPSIFYPQAWRDSHLTEETVRASVFPGPADQKTGLSTVPASSYLLGDKHVIFYPQALPSSNQTEEAPKVLDVLGPADQKSEETTVLSSPFSYKEKHIVFSQQQLPHSHLTEQALKVAATARPADQVTVVSRVSPTLYSHAENPHIFYQQTLPENHLSKQALKVSAVPGSIEQKTGIPVVSSTSYSHREKPSLSYLQELPGSHLPEQPQQNAAVSGFADQKTEIATVTSTSYSHEVKPHIFYQQTFPESHQTEQALKVSAHPSLVDQSSGIPTGISAAYSPGEKPHIFYQQTLPESHQTEQALKVSAPPRVADQSSGIPTGISASYSPGEKPHIFYQQTLPESHQTEQTLKVSAPPSLADQSSGIPSGISAAYSPGEKPHIFYQQTLPESHQTEQALKVSAPPRVADQSSGIPTGISAAYSPGEKPHIFYQQTLPESHQTEQALKGSAPLGLADQRSGIPTVTSASYLHREKPNIIYQQELPVSHLTKEAQKVPAGPGPAQQKTGLPIIPTTSYSHRGRTSFFYQQELPDSHLTKQAQIISSIPGSADQNIGLQTVPSSAYSQRENPIIFYQQELPDSHLTKEALRVSPVLGPADQNIRILSGSSGSYSFEEKPSVVYQQVLPDSHLTEESLKVSSVPGLGDQKTGTLTVPFSSNSHREKPSIFYQQELPDSHLTEQAQKISPVPGPAEQKTGIPTVTSASYSHREKPFIFNPQGLPDSHQPEEALKVTAVPGLADQKVGLPSEPSSSYSHGEKPIIFYPQAFPDTHLTEKILKVPTISGSADQKTGIPPVPSISYPHRDKHIFISPQTLPDSHLHEEALKVSAVSGPADPKIGLPSEPSSSNPHREKPIIFSPQALPDSHLLEEALKVSSVSGPADQKTRLPSEPSSSYSDREKTSVFHEDLADSHLTEEALKVSAVPETSDQKTGIPTVPTSAYSVGGKSTIFHQQALPDKHVTKEALNVSASEPANQKTGLPIVSSTSYSLREKPFIFYPQTLPDWQLTEEALKVSAVPLLGDQKIKKPTATSTYSHRGKPIISYQQELPGSHLPEEALKVSGVPGTADQKTEIPSVLSSSYSYIEKPITSYQEDLTQEALKVLGVSRPADEKTGIPVVTSTSYSHEEKPIISHQELPDHNEETLKALAVSGPVDQKTGIRIVPSTSYSHREGPISSYQKELPHITEKTLEVSAVAKPTDQKTGTQIIPSGSYPYREKGNIFYQHKLPGTTEEALKSFAFPEPAGQKTEIPAGPSGSYSLKDKPKISTTISPDDQKTELPTTPSIAYSNREKPKNLTVIGPDDQKTPLLTVFRNSYSQRVKPSIFFKQHLQDRHHSEDIQKLSSVPEPTDVNSEIPIPLSSSYSNRGNSNILSLQELPEKHITEDVLKVSTVPELDDQKTVLPTVPPSFFPQREKTNIFYQQDLPDRHLTEDALKSSGGLGQADQISGLSTVHAGTYSHSEKPKLVSDHVQRLIDNLDSSNASIISNNMPLDSQVDGRVAVNKPEPSGFENVGSEEFQYADNSSKTLKQIRTLLMEAENIALKRCNFPAPLVPFRDLSDISFIQSKKVVCFKEPPTTEESNVDLPPRSPFVEENPSNKYIQKDISAQTNLKCQRGIENWEFISSTTVRSPIQEAESKARMAVDETLRQYKAARSVMRSEPEGYSGTLGNKILIPMMTIIKSDSSSDASSCSWDSNSLESVSDVLLNFFPYASPKTSMTDSREEEGVSESDDGGGSSVDSLAAHVKNLLKCESSLNHAKQILRNAEEEECRVRARAWNLKFNMAHEHGYSISELNEDDRRKVEEIKAKLFGHERATDLSKGLQSPRGIGCNPEAVCSHIIIESHEKGCFRTLTAKQPQLDSHPCVFRSPEPLDIIRGQRSPLSWRARHVNFSKSLDQSNPHFKVWNSLQLQSHSPFQNFSSDDCKISKGFRMPFHAKMDPWLSELVDPNCVPPEEMDCHSSSQMLPPESMKKFTTSITFSSHRHSKCFSDSSVLKVGVTEDSQCTGASVGVLNSHFPEEQNPPRDIKQKTSSPSSFKIVSHSPGKAVTILAESNRQGQKVSVEHSHQEEKLLERSDFKGIDSEPSTSTNCSKFREVHFSDNHTLISMDRPNSTLGVKEENVTITPNPPSHIFLEQQELFEQSKAPHAHHCVGKHHSPQHQHYVAPKLPCHIFLEKRELFEQSKTPHIDHQVRENYSPLLQGQDYIALDLPSSIFLEQRQLLEQSKAPDIDHHVKKQYSPVTQGQDCIIENNDQQKPKSHSSNINVETKVNNVVSQSAPDQRTLVTSPKTPPSNRKALSCVRITLSPKTPSQLNSGTLDKGFLSLDPASKTRMNNEFNSDLQTISSRSLEPTSKLLTSKPIAHDQESLGFLGPKSSPDFQVKQPLLDSNTVTQDLKTIPFQNSQIVTSRQTQVNFSDLEENSNPEGRPVSADRSLEQIKPPFSTFSGKLSSDAVTQITTESPGKAVFSSEIFINTEDHGHEISESSSQKVGKVPIKFASSSSVQQKTVSRDAHGAQPSLLPYKPSGSTKMYYVPQFSQIPSSLDSKSDTTIESSHSGSNDAIAPDFPAQMLGTRDNDVAFPVNIKHKEGIYSKRAVTKPSLSMGKKPFQKDNADAQVQVLITGDENLSEKNEKKEIYNKKAITKPAQPEEIEISQKDAAGSSDAVAAELSAQLQDTNIERLPDTKAIKQKGETHTKRTFPKEAWTENKESLQIDIEESRCHSDFENTTHSVFRSSKFYFHHPVHLPSDQDFCHESLGGSVFMRHSWKDFFQHHPDRQHTCLPPPYQNEEKTDYTRIESVSINVNLENKEMIHPTKSQAGDYVKYDKQVNDQKKDLKVTPEPTLHITSLNELWNKYQERQKQQKPPGFSGRKEVSLVERLDRLAKLLQNPITHSLRPSESTQDDSRGQRDAKEWRGRQQQQKNKLQKMKRYKSLEKCHKNIGDLKKSKVLSAHQAGGSNQIKIEQVKFDKYILRKQPGFHYINSTSSDSRPSEDSELLTDTATNILSTTTSPVESDILTQTDKEVTLHERSSSISTIDTARLIQAFGHERVCLSPRRIKLYSSISDHQRRYIEKRSKNKKKALSTGYPQMTSEHTRRKRIQVASHMISSDSVSSSTGSFCSSSSALCNKQNVHMLNKGVQAGNLEIVNGVRKHTRDVGVIFPTPSSSKGRVEEDSDVTSWSEEKIEEKRLLTSYLGDKKLRKNKQSCSEGVSWFVPVENGKSGPKKENLLKHRGPGISWFAPVTNTKPWREPLREQNWQGQPTDSHGSLAGPGRGPLKPFVRATLQESLQLHRPDFISRSGERIKRLKLIVQERKLQNVLQSEREALFNTVREWQGHRDPMLPLCKRGFLAAQKGRPIGKKEMIQRSKRIYEQLPEVQKKREEEKRRLEYKSYRLRAQLYKKKVTNQLLGRKVPWD